MKNKDKGYVYAIHCKKNSKSYIGSTCRPNGQRFNEHRYRLRTNSHQNKHLQNAWNKYKEDSFEFTIIEHTDNLVAIEEHYIKITGSYKKQYGFNKSTNAACPNRGTVRCKKLNKIVSDKLKGRVSPMKGKKNPQAVINLEKAFKANMKKVRCIGMDEIYPSLTLAAFCHRRNLSTLVEALKNGTRCAGFYWEYV